MEVYYDASSIFSMNTIYIYYLGHVLRSGYDAYLYMLNYLYLGYVWKPSWRSRYDAQLNALHESFS